MTITAAAQTVGRTLAANQRLRDIKLKKIGSVPVLSTVIARGVKDPRPQTEAEISRHSGR